jgi:hypothetical protein
MRSLIGWRRKRLNNGMFLGYRDSGNPDGADDGNHATGSETDDDFEFKRIELIFD